MIDTLKYVITQIIGTYTPITYTTYIGENEVSVIPDGLAGVDFGFVISGLMLIVCIYGIIRIIGGIIHNV